MHDRRLEPAPDQTRALQSAIDELSASGGGRVILSPGTHGAGALRLKSHVTLVLEAGAVLALDATDPELTDNRVGVIAEQSDFAFLTAAGARDIAIVGAGEIRAPGDAYIIGDDPEVDTFIPASKRPRTLVFENCENVRLEGVRVSNSPMWTLHLVACTRVAVRHVRIDNNRRLPNTDGIVIDGCSDVAVEHVDISTADDGVCLKTSRRAEGIRPVKNVSVRFCTVSSQSCALKLGTESFGDFDNVSFEDCSVVDSNRALGLFSRDGGHMRNVRFARISVECHETPDGFWGSGEALTVTVVTRRIERPAGRVENLVVEDISGVMEGAVNLVASEPGQIRNASLKRVDLVQKPGRLGTGLRHDMRPTPADLVVAADQKGRVNAWTKDATGRVVGLEDYPGGMPGLYAKGIDDLVLDEVRVARPTPLPAGWNQKAVVLEG
jgi:polygalacturonase